MDGRHTFLLAVLGICLTFLFDGLTWAQSSPRTGAAAPAGAPEPPSKIGMELARRFAIVDLPQPATGYAYDETTGRMAIAGSYGNSLAVFSLAEAAPGSQPEPQLIDLKGPVVSVVVKPLGKRRLFVAGVNDPPRLVVVDGQSLAMLKSYAVEAGVPRQLASSEAIDDTTVIYFSEPDLVGPRRFDFRSGKEERRLGRSILDFALTPDGKTLYFRTTDQNLGQGLHLATWTDVTTETPTGLRRQSFKSGEPAPMYLHPAGWFVAVGRQLLTPDLRAVLTNVGFEPQAFLANQPWMAGWDKDRLVVGSINDGRVVAQVTFPPNWLEIGPTRNQIGFRPRGMVYSNVLPVNQVFADAKRNRFLAGLSRHLVILPLDAFALPAEPILWGDHQVPEVATFGEPWRAILHYPEPLPEITLTTAPEGMKVKGNRLEWIPQSDQLGEHRIDVAATIDQTSRKESWTVRVERPSLELPFAANELRFDPSSRRVLVLGDRILVSSSPPTFQRLAVVDLPTQKLLATKRLDTPCEDAECFGDDVYAAAGTRVARFAADSLEPRAEFTSATGLPNPTWTVSLPGSSPRRFDLLRLELLADQSPDSHSWNGWLVGRTSFGRLDQGILHDRVSQRPKLLLWPFDFRRVPWHGNPAMSRAGVRMADSLAVDRWHPFLLQFSAPRIEREQRVLKFQASPDLPALLGIMRTERGIALASFFLRDGEPAAQILLLQERRLQSPFPVPSPDDANVALATSPTHYAAAVRKRLYWGSLDEIRGELQPPFYIEPSQDLFVIPHDRPVTIRYKAPGAIKYRLAADQWRAQAPPKIAESTNGTFEFSASDAVADIVQAAAGLMANLPAGRDVDNATRLERFIGPSRAAFQRLVGREPNGVPLPVGVQVTAEGGSLQTAWLRHDFLIEVPPQQILAALNKLYPHARDPWSEQSPDEEGSPRLNDPLFAYHVQTSTLPHPGLDGTELRKQAASAKSLGDDRLRKTLESSDAARDWRYWIDKKGNRVEAALVEHFGGQIILRTRRGNELVLSEEDLSDSDRKYLEKPDRLTVPSDSLSWRRVAFRAVLDATAQFVRSHQYLPPRALIDSNAKPLLSWRVLLLPDLGYPELYDLFHFDEPWDSPHNRLLMEYIPICFVLDPNLEPAHKTTLVTVSSPLSGIRFDRAVRTESMTAEHAPILLFVETLSKRSVEWTRPEDLRLRDLSNPAESLRSHEARVLAGLYPPRVESIPATVSRDGWRSAVEIGDHRSFDPAVLQPR